MHAHQAKHGCLLQALKYEQRSSGDVWGGSVFGYDDVHARLARAVPKWRPAAAAETQVLSLSAALGLLLFGLQQLASQASQTSSSACSTGIL